MAFYLPHKIPVSTLASFDTCTATVEAVDIAAHPMFVHVPALGTNDTSDRGGTTMCIDGTTYNVKWDDVQGKGCDVELPKLEQTLKHFLPEALAARMLIPPYNCYQAGVRVSKTALVKVGVTNIEFCFRAQKGVTCVDKYKWSNKDGSSVTRCYDHTAGCRVS